MKRNPGKLFLMLCLLVVGGGVVANAQIEGQTRIVSDVPFDFVVGKTTLPAGKYEIRRFGDSTPNVLEIQSANGGTAVVFITEDAQTRDNQAASQTDLVFDNVGDQYFLSQVWEAGSAYGSELAKPRMEKRLAYDGSQSEKRSVVASTKQA
jgi:hypothetical protein